MSIVKISNKKAAYLVRICYAYKMSKTKFGYACMKNEKLLQKALEKFHEGVEDKQRELASVDEKGNLLIGENGAYSYSKENKAKFDEFFKKESKVEIEVDFYVCKDFSSIKDNVALLSDLNGTIVEVDEESIYDSVVDEVSEKETIL